MEKPLGRRIELGVGPGRYEVHCQDGGRARSSQFQSDDGASRVLTQSDFKDAKLDPTLQRGGTQDAPNRMGLDGVHRVSLEGGISHRPASRANYVTGPEGHSQAGTTANFALTNWIRPRIGLELRVHSLEKQRHGPISVTPNWFDTTFVTGVLVGGRFELNGSSSASAARPFLHASVGPYFRPASSEPIDPLGVPETRGSTLWGASLGVGLDLRFGSHLGLGLRSSYDLMPDYKDASGNRSNYRGLTITLATSWFFGGSRPKK